MINGDHHGGRVVTGVAAAAFAQPQSVAEPMALRDALRRLPAGEVEDLADPRGHGEDYFEAV